MSDTPKMTLLADWKGEAPTPEQLAEILRLHSDWYFGRPGGVRANLEGANLDRANLEGAYLVRANLEGANLQDAYLVRANLRGANLEGANLRGANLEGAYLRGAYLQDANLRGANLEGANLQDAYLPDGVVWETYLSEVVPALLTAGGKALAEVATAKNWECHSWDNCPIATAFSVHSISDVPPLYRGQANLFIQLFDQRLIPRPVTAEATP